VLTPHVITVECWTS